MTRYTVVWVRDAVETLATIWISAEDRSKIRLATERVDSELQADPESKGKLLAEDLRSLRVPPLQVSFVVKADDRIVEVLTVRAL